MRILHTYCLNYNIGDYALGIGVKNLLRHFLEVDYIAEVNLQGREFNEYYINEVVNKKYDLLVIGGGGIIHGAHWPNGWFWLIEKDLIETIEIPFIVYAPGYNYFKGEEGIPEKGIDHLKKTYAHASYFSIRNDGSYSRLLDQTGLDVPEIPDSGFHVGLDTEYQRPIEEPYVMVQLADDKPGYRFGSNEKRKKVVEEFRAIVKYLTRKYLVILAPHVFADVELCREVGRGISNSRVWDFGNYAFDHSDKAVGYYKYAEIALSMRGHGQIVPISFNTPTLSLENHPKNRGLMEKLDLAEYNADVLQEGFSSKVKRLINEVESNRVELVHRYKDINKDLMDVSRAAFQDIESSIAS